MRITKLTIDEKSEPRPFLKCLRGRMWWIGVSLFLLASDSSFPSIAQDIEPKDRLNVGDQLATDTGIGSSDGRYILVVQSDCNVVLYKLGIHDGKVRAPRWNSHTERTGVNCYLEMQGDENLVAYQPPRSPKWSSMTPAGVNRGSPYAVIQNDGKFVVYRNPQQALRGFPDGIDQETMEVRQEGTRLIRTLYSGEQWSGEGDKFNGTFYFLAAPPTPRGYRLVEQHFSLRGDRGCSGGDQVNGAAVIPEAPMVLINNHGWAECKLEHRGEDGVTWQFRMQGHSDSGPYQIIDFGSENNGPRFTFTRKGRQATSIGILTIVYEKISL